MEIVLKHGEIIFADLGIRRVSVLQIDLPCCQCLIREVVLHPEMNIQQAIAVFDAAEAETLAVVDGDGERRPIGILSESHAMRRYAEESEQRRREAIGEI